MRYWELRSSRIVMVGEANHLDDAALQRHGDASGSLSLSAAKGV
jgi:hypothetical protein